MGGLNTGPMMPHPGVHPYDFIIRPFRPRDNYFQVLMGTDVIVLWYFFKIILAFLGKFEYIRAIRR